MSRASHAPWLIGAWLGVCPDGGSLRLREALADPALDWQNLMAFANEQLLVPLLHDALVEKSLQDVVPVEVRDYLAFLSARNDERNQRLEQQIVEACRALNRAGISAMLIKGAAELMEPQPAGGRAAVVVGDLDMLVCPRDAGAARDTLTDLGYSVLHQYPTRSHAVADLYRPRDAAVIDLHRSALVLSALLPGETLWADGSLQSRGGANFRLPSPADHLLCRVLHDQVQEGNLGTAEIRLRSVYQVARTLQRHKNCIDLARIERRVQPHGLSLALTTVLTAAHELFGAPVAPRAAPNLVSRVAYGRRLLRLRYPMLARLNNAIGNVSSPFARYHYGPVMPGTAGRWRLMKMRLRYGVPALAHYGGMLARRLLRP